MTWIIQLAIVVGIITGSVSLVAIVITVLVNAREARTTAIEAKLRSEMALAKVDVVLPVIFSVVKRVVEDGK